MKQKHLLLFTSLALASIVACNSTKEKEKEKETVTEKVIALPAITKGTNSVHNQLKQKLPYRYTAKEIMTVDVLEDSAWLHIKNDSCWIEYKSNVIVHKKQQDGSEKSAPMEVLEQTDTVAVK